MQVDDVAASASSNNALSWSTRLESDSTRHYPDSTPLISRLDQVVAFRNRRPLLSSASLVSLLISGGGRAGAESRYATHSGESTIVGTQWIYRRQGYQNALYTPWITYLRRSLGPRPVCVSWRQLSSLHSPDLVSATLYCLGYHLI